MYARKLLAGLAATATTVSALALLAGPASAAVDPDDTTFTPVAADLVGVGSDTSQHALKLAAGAWNSATPAPTFKIATYAATGGGDVTLAAGTTIGRPNGSGAGKKLLYGAGNNVAVDFARSSSAQSAEETGAGLQSFPFALDTLKMAVSGSVTTNAPVNLSAADIVKIYKGDVTNWNQLGGQSGAIAPKIPQAGSGTRSFFESQLKEANGGTAVALASSVAEVQEHDDAQIKNNANAIAPFSAGRAGLLGSTLRLESGWEAKRALYNVVRGAQVGDSKVQAVFGVKGYLCSADAAALIKEAGFDQLATPARGGVCGAQTTAASSNFTLNAPVATKVTVQVGSTVARQVTATARVTGSTAPQGSVTFYQGSRMVKTGVPLVSGQAVYKAASAPGKQTFKAVFVPTPDTVFVGSEGTGAGNVKTTSKVAAKFPKKVKKGAKAKGTVTVTLVGTGAKAVGKVQVKAGKKVVGKGALKAGKATIKVKGLKKGKNKLTVTWSGDSNAVGSKTVVNIKRKK